MNDYIVDVDIDPQLAELILTTLAEESPRARDAASLSAYIEGLVGFILSEEGVRGGTEVSVTLACEEMVRGLNKLHRGIDRTTDVLSFPCDDPFESTEDEVLLGDIVIDLATACGQSREYGTTYMEELVLLITHGVLHLLGYDHVEDADAAVMEPREKELRDAWVARG